MEYSVSNDRMNNEMEWIWKWSQPNLKIAVFWDIVPRSLIERAVPDDAGSRNL
jgi:hypothetical protein